MNKAHARWVIYLTLGCALVLMLLPFSTEWRSLRPDIVSLALFYWVLALPHRVGITTAFAVGISQDLIEGAPLGLSSPGLMLATLLVLFSYQRIRQYDPLQQSLVVLVLLLLMLKLILKYLYLCSLVEIYMNKELRLKRLDEKQHQFFLFPLT